MLFDDIKEKLSMGDATTPVARKSVYVKLSDDLRERSAPNLVELAKQIYPDIAELTEEEVPEGIRELMFHIEAKEVRSTPLIYLPLHRSTALTDTLSNSKFKDYVSPKEGSPYSHLAFAVLENEEVTIIYKDMGVEAPSTLQYRLGETEREYINKFKRKTSSLMDLGYYDDIDPDRIGSIFIISGALFEYFLQVYKDSSKLNDVQRTAMKKHLHCMVIDDECDTLTHQHIVDFCKLVGKVYNLSDECEDKTFILKEEVSNESKRLAISIMNENQERYADAIKTGEW